MASGIAADVEHDMCRAPALQLQCEDAAGDGDQLIKLSYEHAMSINAGAPLFGDLASSTTSTFS
jgi:hypothetical protein